MRIRRSPTAGMLAGLSMLGLAPAGAASAEEAVATAPHELGEVVVFGRGEAKIGVAQAASEGTVSGGDLLVRPLLRVAELLEAVPGLVAAQHSGSGKANQYFLRGFNLDHGTDFTTYIDGVQMNLRSHGHGQGYLDMNGLIPEIVEREDFRKGPYRADGGDFALAGAAYMTTIEAYDRPWAAAEAGSWGSRRLAAGGTTLLGGGDLTLVGEAKVYDGPWKEGEHLRHYAAFGKYATAVNGLPLDFTLHFYRGDWRPTEQIPERLIGSAICPDVFCSPDPTARGRTTRAILNAAIGGEDWRANGYVQFYDWAMYSNPTYGDAGGDSAQIRQFDRRWVLGLRAHRSFLIAPSLDVRLGTENRYDTIGNVGVWRTDARRFVESFGRYAVDEASAAAFAEATWKPVDGLRIYGGLRGDYYHLDVRALDAPAAALGEGRGHDSVVSPKAGVSWAVSDRLELYGAWGRGFHSNDVRGVVNAASPVPALVKGTGKELGARFQLPHLSLTATYWWLAVGSELRFVGDSNAVEPTGASSRHGYELVAFWRPVHWLAIDANYTANRARYDNGDHIPNAFKNSGQIGVSAVRDHWEGSVRLRHLGGYPLIEDNSVRDKGSTVVNLRGAWKSGDFEVYGEVLNVFDSRDKDIAYFYESQVPGFDPAPVEGRLSRVMEPRTFRVGIKRRL